MSFIPIFFYAIFVLIRPQEWWPPLQGVSVIQYSMIAAMLTALGTKRPRDFQWSPQTPIILLLLLVVFLSTLLTGWLAGAISSATWFATTDAIPFIVLSLLISGHNQQRVLMIICIIACLFMVSNAISQRNSEIGLGWAGTFMTRVDSRITYTGIFNDPNDLGMFIVMSMPFVCYFFIKHTFILKLLWLSVMGGLLYGVLLTNSRGTLLGVFSLIGFAFFLRYGLKKSIFMGALGAPAAFIIMSKFRTISADESSAHGRLDAWYYGYQMFLADPIFGVGRAQFVEYHFRTAHNSMVLVLAELGITGLYLWAGFIFLTCLMLYHIHSLKDEVIQAIPSKTKVKALLVEKDLALALLFSFIGYLTTSFFLSRSYAPVLYLFTGMAVALYYRVRILCPEVATHNYYGYWKHIAGVTAAIFVSIYLVVKILL